VNLTDGFRNGRPELFEKRSSPCPVSSNYVIESRLFRFPIKLVRGYCSKTSIIVVNRLGTVEQRRRSEIIRPCLSTAFKLIVEGGHCPGQCAYARFFLLQKHPADSFLEAPSAGDCDTGDNKIRFDHRWRPLDAGCSNVQTVNDERILRRNVLRVRRPTTSENRPEVRGASMVATDVVFFVVVGARARLT